MEHFMLITLAGLVVCTIGLPSVVRFEVDRQDTLKVGLQSFKFNSCLPESKEIAVVQSVSIMPDPLDFPGQLEVSFTIDFKDNVKSPVKTSVYLAKKVGSTWIKIPCIGQIGSCTYDDFCQILSGISECPPAFTAAGVPCQCPFNKGLYKLPLATFDVESAILPPGDYSVQANFSMNGNVVGCYEATATFG